MIFARRQSADRLRAGFGAGGGHGTSAANRHPPVSLVAIQIFGRHIVFGHFTRANFLFISVPGTFHAGYHAGLKRIPFLEQLIDALGRGTFYVG
jgi:hypothetical protein